MRIDKFILEDLPAPSVVMPAGSALMNLQMTKDGPAIFALINPEVELIKRTFRKYRTEEQLSEDDNTMYVGSYIDQNYVEFHLFEINSPDYPSLDPE